MPEENIYFIPLGGGQRVGASCYYLRLGNANIILDAGTGKEKGVLFAPDLYTLLTSPFIQSLSQINQIYISHAHADHIGYLPELMRKTSKAEVYMTKVTSLFAEYQFSQKNVIKNNKNLEYMKEKQLEAQYILDRAAIVSYMQSIDFGRYQVTFLPAGHIPGAMMMLFTCGKRKILYTGDYSMERTPLTDGCMIPDNSMIDTVILCGLHAKQPEYRKKSDGLVQKAQDILQIILTKHVSVLCRVPQMSKGIEFLEALNEQNLWNIPIYIDQSIMQAVVKMEQLSVPVLNHNNKIMENQHPVFPHLYLTSDYTVQGYGFYQEIYVDFSLHEDFPEMKKLIKQINPKQVILVHCAKESSPSGETIEQELMRDGECRTQFIFAEEQEIYQL